MAADALKEITDRAKRFLVCFEREVEIGRGENAAPKVLPGCALLNVAHVAREKGPAECCTGAEYI